MHSAEELSPFILDNSSKAIFGSVTTNGVYTIAAIGMAISAVFAAFVMIGGQSAKQ